MEPSPVPRTPRSQITRPAPAAAEDGAAAAPAEIITTPRDSVESWTTEKINPFAPAADQRIVVKEVGKPHWEAFRTLSIMLLSTQMAAWDWMLYMAGQPSLVPSPTAAPSPSREIAADSSAASFAFALRLPERLLRRCRRPLLPLLLLPLPLPPIIVIMLHLLDFFIICFYTKRRQRREKR